MFVRTAQVVCGVFLFLANAGCAPKGATKSSRKLIGQSTCAYPKLDSADVAVILTVDSIYNSLIPRYALNYKALYAHPNCFRLARFDSTFLYSFQKTYQAKLDSSLTYSLVQGIDPGSELYIHKYATNESAERAQRTWERVRTIPLPPAYRRGGEGEDEYNALAEYSQMQIGPWLIGGFLHGHIQDNQFIPNGYAPLSQDFFERVTSSSMLNARAGGSTANQR